MPRSHRKSTVKVIAHRKDGHQETVQIKVTHPTSTSPPSKPLRQQLARRFNVPADEPTCLPMETQPDEPYTAFMSGDPIFRDVKRKRLATASRSRGLSQGGAWQGGARPGGGSAEVGMAASDLAGMVQRLQSDLDRRFQESENAWKRELSSTQKELGVTQKKLGFTEKKLGVTQKKLGVTHKEIGITQKELGIALKDLGIAQKGLGIAQGEIAVIRADLEASRKEVGDVQAELRRRTIERRPLQIYAAVAAVAKELDPKGLMSDDTAADNVCTFSSQIKNSIRYRSDAFSIRIQERPSRRSVLNERFAEKLLSNLDVNARHLQAHPNLDMPTLLANLFELDIHEYSESCIEGQSGLTLRLVLAAVPMTDLSEWMDVIRSKPNVHFQPTLEQEERFGKLLP